MSDIIGNDAAHPEWQQLLQAALFELDPMKLLERIDHARNAVLNCIEETHSKQAALRDALAALDCLRRITEGQRGLSIELVMTTKPVAGRHDRSCNDTR
jgi:hypothetical protein